MKRIVLFIALFVCISGEGFAQSAYQFKGDVTATGTVTGTRAVKSPGFLQAGTYLKVGKYPTASLPTLLGGEIGLVWDSTTASFKQWNGSAWSELTASGGSGTVTSVALTVPSFLSISGSPITTSGTLAITATAASGNVGLFSPSNGSSGATALRAMVSADMPASGVSAGSYTLPHLTIDAKGRVTAASNGGASDVTLGGDLSGTANSATVAKIRGKTMPTPGMGDDGKVLTYDHGTGAFVFNTAGTGTLSSLAFTLPDGFNASPNPITSDGTVTIGLDSQADSAILIAPLIGGTPTWRALVAGDAPNLPATKITSGTFPALNGSNLTNLTVANLTAGGTFPAENGSALTAITGANVVGDIPGNAASITTTLPISKGGTNATNSFSAFANLSPMSTLGDILYENATPIPARLGGNTTTTKKFLSQTGTGTISAVPAWSALVAGDVPSIPVTKLDAGGTLPAEDGSALTNLTPANLSAPVPATLGGSGQTSLSASFNAFSPITTLGDLIYGSATNTSSRLGGNTTTTKKFLNQTGNGSVSAAPGWSALIAADIPNLPATQITSGTFPALNGSNLTSLTPANLASAVPPNKGGTGLTTLPTAILQGNGTSNVSGVTIGTGLSFAGGTLANTNLDTAIEGSTFVIAASDSIAPTRADTLYRCTGTADDVKINAAITALGSVGGKITFLEGTYNTVAPITVARSNVTLAGQGPATIIKRGWNSALANQAVMVIGNGTTSYSNVQIRDLQIDGNKGTYSSANNVSVHFNAFTSGTLTNCSIQNLKIINSGGSAFMSAAILNGGGIFNCNTSGNLFSADPVLYTGSKGFSIDHLYSDGDGTGILSFGPLQISNCKIQNTTSTTGAPYWGIGIGVEEFDGGVITDNVVKNTTYWGIGSAAGASGVGSVIRGNIVQAAHLMGLNINAFSDCVIENNLITSTVGVLGTGYGIFLGTGDRNTVSNNTLLDNAGWGIYVDTGATKTRLYLNRFENNSSGEYQNSGTSTQSLVLSTDAGQQLVAAGDGGFQATNSAGTRYFQTAKSGDAIAHFSGGVELSDGSGHAFQLTTGTAAPSGVCTDGTMYIRTGTGNGSLWLCSAGTWGTH